MGGGVAVFSFFTSFLPGVALSKTEENVFFVCRKETEKKKLTQKTPKPFFVVGLFCLGSRSAKQNKKRFFSVGFFFCFFPVFFCLGLRSAKQKKKENLFFRQTKRIFCFAERGLRQKKTEKKHKKKKTEKKTERNRRNQNPETPPPKQEKQKKKAFFSPVFCLGSRSAKQREKNGFFSEGKKLFVIIFLFC